MTAGSPVAAPVVLDIAGFASLIDALIDDGRTVVAPTLRDGAIIHDEITGAGDLPAGWGDEQDSATYRVRRRDDAARFGYAATPQSWKRLLFPPRTTLWSAHRDGDHDARGFEVEDVDPGPRYAFVGVRACEVHAIAIQDRVFLDGAHSDPHYSAVRSDAVLVAVACGEPASTCFCASMGTGPRVPGGADVVLTEVVESAPSEPWYLAEPGSERGAALLARVPNRAATATEVAAAEAVVAGAERRMGRSMPPADLHALMAGNLEHPRWDEVAARCLACTNCTLVCPTCFCSSVEDITDLMGTEARRERRWASCFELDHSYLHGGSVRGSVRSRYRQWLTHKLGTWFDQFGTSGCVGCGRCITWCPAAIDITEEVRAIAGPLDSEVAP